MTAYEIFKKGDPLSDQQLKELIKFYKTVEEMVGSDKKFGFMLDELRYVAERCEQFQRARKEK